MNQVKTHNCCGNHLSLHLQLSLSTLQSKFDKKCGGHNSSKNDNIKDVKSVNCVAIVVLMP